MFLSEASAIAVTPQRRSHFHCRVYLDLERKYVCLVVPSTRSLHASWHVIAAGSDVVPVAHGARFPNDVAVLVAPSVVEIPSETRRQRTA